MSESVARFRVGFANLRMGYSYTDAWTPKREKRSADLLRTAGRASVYGLVEAHEENDMVDRWFKHWPDRFELVTGSANADGNGLVFDTVKHDLISHHTYPLGWERYATRFNLVHRASSVRYWLIVPHLIAGSDNGPKRDAQMRRLLDGCDSIHRGLILGDLNNFSYYAGGPMQQARARGWRDAYAHAPIVSAAARAYGSHHGTLPGRSVDHILARDLVTVEEYDQVLTGKVAGYVSDHNWLTAVVSIPGESGR